MPAHRRWLAGMARTRVIVYKRCWHGGCEQGGGARGGRRGVQRAVAREGRGGGSAACVTGSVRVSGVV